MGAREPVSREELLELAILEAMGTLDEVDSATLNRLFHEAPPALQSEIRALQASISSDQSLLPDEAPAADLRPRVITRVRDEIAADQAALAPLATIGPRRSGNSEATEQLIELVQLRAAHASARADAARWSRTSVMWRAASIAVGAMLLVSLYYNIASNQYAVRIGQLALDANAREELSRALGSSYRDFAEGGCLVRGMSAARPGFSGAATVYVNRRSGEALIVTFGLPEEIRYGVRAVREDGQVFDLGTITPSGHHASLRISNVDSFQLAFARLEIVDPSGVVVLRT